MSAVERRAGCVSAEPRVAEPRAAEQSAAEPRISEQSAAEPSGEPSVQPTAAEAPEFRGSPLFDDTPGPFDVVVQPLSYIEPSGKIHIIVSILF
jgi:hypothetical protein